VNFAFDGPAAQVNLRGMFEHRTRPLLPPRAFYVRLGRSTAVAATIVLGALGLGMIGYHGFEQLSWLDAFLNASMILSGMGPVSPIQSSGGKVFAGCYALFSGLAFVTALGVVFAPIYHRFLHKFHLDIQD
jgi:hypothetical protein